MGLFNSATQRDIEALGARIGRLEELVILLARRQGVTDAEIEQLVGVRGAAPSAAPAAAAGVSHTAGVSAAVRQLAIDGKKIQAIKLHRQETGVGLKEAKDAVEAL